MNSLAAITFEDFVKGYCFPNINERRSMIVTKVLSFVFGAITFGLVFVASMLGDILSVSHLLRLLTLGLR